MKKKIILITFLFCLFNTVLIPMSDDLEKGQLGQQTTCLICFEDFINSHKKKIFLKCPGRHPFHKKCIIPWLQYKPICPYDRAIVDTSQIFSLKERMIYNLKRDKPYWILLGTNLAFALLFFIYLIFINPVGQN